MNPSSVRQALQTCLDTLELPAPVPDEFGTCYTASQRSATVANAKMQARLAILEARAIEAIVPELLTLARDFESYLELKLEGFRREYPEDHCIVQTAVRYLEQARAAQRKAGAR